MLISVNSTWNIWNFRRPLVEALLADGHEITIVAPKDDAALKLEALGCKVRHLKMSVKGLNPLQDVTLLYRLRRIFQEVGPDIVLSFTIKNNIFGALAAKALKVAFIPNVTGLGTAFLSGGTLERVAVVLYRKAFSELQIVFFQNDDDRTLFVKKGIVTNGQGRRLPGSGIDLDHFAFAAYPTERVFPVFLMISRLLKDKGVHEFVDAARIIKAQHPETRFQLLGAAESKNRSAIDKETVHGWEQAGVVEYLGTVDDVRPFIEIAHCVVLPSYREGAPRTLIEAAAMGRPIITTDVPGCRDVVDDQKTGFLCEMRSGESLAAACEKFLELSTSDRITMGNLGRKKIELEFDQKLVVKAYRSVLKDMLRAV
ncbi:MAG: glycosyltransferase family 4 protein [Pseudomonadota bacterium]